MASLPRPSIPSPLRLVFPSSRVSSLITGLGFPRKVLSPSFATESSSPFDSSEADSAPDPVKLRLAKAKEYKKTKGKDDKVPPAVKLAFEKVTEYKTKKGESEGAAGVKKVVNEKKEQFKVSSTDFLGLGFSDKKEGRGLPAGLVPLSDPFPEGKLPEVEMLVGDATNFGDGDVGSNSTQEENLDTYKPKVSTWGVFPRPNNISKTYGGGRVLRPGEVLETAEDRAAKEARTRQFLSEYKRKFGLNIPPKLKAECETALNDGDSFMDVGNLKEALPFYEKIMDKLPFQSELHGLAALQWSICQDSLNRSNEARSMYEKLQSHSNPRVSKRARQLNFGFQAMEMLKVTTSSSASSRNTDYQNYFDAFVKDDSNYTAGESKAEESTLKEAFPYLVLLLAPLIICVFVIAIRN